MCYYKQSQTTSVTITESLKYTKKFVKQLTTAPFKH